MNQDRRLYRQSRLAPAEVDTCDGRISLRSHARAAVHVRWTDLDEMPSASAVSCRVRPANTRHSTTRRARSSSTRQPIERDVDGQHFFGLHVVEQRRLVAPLERHRTRVASALLAGARSRVVDQDPAHRDAGHRQQAVAIHDLDVMLSQQPQVGFVHERRRRQRVVR